MFTAATQEQRIGEATPSYLASRDAPVNIAKLQPDARIIAILREPSAFVRSLHMQRLQMHVETEADLRKALALEELRRQGKQIPRDAIRPEDLLYSDQVRYVEQLRRYHAVFAPEQVLVLIYEDFRRDNEATVRQVLRFLQVDDGRPDRAGAGQPDRSCALAACLSADRLTAPGAGTGLASRKDSDQGAHTETIAPRGERDNSASFALQRSTSA